MSDEDLLSLAKSLKPDDRADKLRGALTTGLQFNPDEYAKAIKTSATTGVVPTAILRDPKAFENQIDHASFVNVNPKTADWLVSKAEHAAIAHDDLEVLTGLESASERAIILARNAATVRNRMAGGPSEFTSAAARINKGTIGAISSFLSAAGQSADWAAYSVGQLVNVLTGPTTFDTAMQNITSVRPSQMEGLGSTFARRVNDPLQQYFESSSKARAPLFVQLPDGSSTYNWKEIGAYWDLIAENAPQLAVQWGASMKAFNAAKVAGASDAAAAVQAAAVARPIEWSQTVGEEFGNARQKDVPMLQGIATSAASATAQTMISQGLPGGGGGLDALLFERLAKSSAGKKGVVGALQRGVLGAAKEGTEEAAQEAVSVLGQRTYDPTAFQGAGGRIATAAIGGALVGGPMASIAFRDNVREISDLAAQSKLKGRDAEAFAGFMKQVGGEAFIDANRLTTFFQENGIDPIKGAEMVGARNYAEAMVAGTDAVVSVGDLVAKLKPEQVNALADDLRVGQGELSAREVEDYQAQSAKVDLAKGAEPVTAGPRQIIAEDTYRQLVDTGMAPRVAEVYADRHARVMENLAKDYGQDPVALNERYGLKIIQAESGVSPTEAVLSDGRPVDLTRQSDMEAYLAENPELDPLFWQGAVAQEVKQAAPKIQTPEFKSWFGGSKAVDQSGAPRVFYHGTMNEFGGFQTSPRGIFFSEQPTFASAYSGDGADSRVIPVYLKAEKPFDYQNPADVEAYKASGGTAPNAVAQGDWTVMENPEFQDFLKANGYDSYYLVEEIHGKPFRNIAVFDPTQIKSALSNTGAFDPNDPNIMFQPAYHGSPYRFDKFTLDHIGKGEGAQAYGWGLYFAGTKEVAEFYRQQLAVDMRKLNDIASPFDGESPEYAARKLRQAAKQSKLSGRTVEAREYEETALWIERGRPDNFGGQTYKVDIPEDGNYLLWDKPLSDQPEAVKKALNDVGGKHYQFYDATFAEDAGSMSGADLYRRIVRWVYRVKDASGKNGETAYNSKEEALSAAGGDARRVVAVGNYDQKTASMILNDAGIVGIKYEDGSTRASDGEKSYNYVIFDANAVKTLQTYYQPRAEKMSERMRKLAQTTRAAMDKSMSTEYLADDAAFAAFDESVKALQAGDIHESKRGFIQFSPDRKVSIGFLEKMDLTTFIHETGHMYLEVAGDLAQENPDSEGAKQYAKILGFLGVESRADLTRDQHEKFATAMEAYALEGKAPTPELKSAFQRVKYWMMHVYRSLSSLNVRLNDEIRGVFDRFLAGDEAVSATEMALEIQPMFASAEDMNATQAEFEAYSKMAGRATMTAREAVEAKLMRELTREREAWWKEELAKTAEDVAAELRESPGYVALRTLTQGEDGIKLSKQALLDAGMTQEALNALPRSKSRVYGLEGGMDLQAAAEVLGFPSGDDLLSTLRELKPFREQVKEVAESRMKEKHGDMMTDGSLTDDAIEAIHNGHYADLRMAELRVLDRMKRQAKPAVDVATKQIKAQAKDAQATLPPIRSFRDAAIEIVEGTAIRDLQPHRYLQARVKASQEASKAYTKLDFEAASEAKRREILNHFLYLEATKAREEAAKVAEYGRKAGDKKFLQRLGKGGEDYLNQWLALAGRYDFTQISRAAIDQNLQEWAKAKEAEGIIIDPLMFDEGRVKNWREVPVVELRALHDALVNIETVARRSRMVQAGEKEVDFDTAVHDLTSQAYGNFKAKALPLDEETRSRIDKAVSYAKKWNVDLLKFEEVVDRLDKGDINGPWRRYIFEPMALAQYREFELNRQMTLALNEAMEQMPKKMRRSLSDEVTLDGIGTVSRKWLVSMAMNTGNESNQTKLLKGMGWADPAGMENFGKALDKLTREEWMFVQKTWDALESLWPEIASLEKRMTGLEPPKVERTPFTVTLQDGSTLEMQGGYYPLVYDPKRSGQGALQTDADIMSPEGMFKGPVTFKGHTKERVENFAAPLLFDFEQVLSRHVPKVVKDVSHREPAMSVAKLLRDQGVRQSVQETIGPEYEAAMMPWLQGTVNDPAGSNTELMSWLGKARSNLVVASLAFRASSVIVQVMDPVRALVGEHAVKPQYMLGATAKLTADLARFDLKTIREIRAMSGEMAGRAENLDRDLRSMWRRNLGKEGFYAETQRAGMKGLAVADALTSTVVWLGAYDQAIAEGSSRGQAIREADRVVRLKLMTGAAKDLTKLQRSPDMASKLITTYMGDAVSVYGMLSRSVHNVSNGEKIASSAFAFLMAGMILPVLADAVKGKAPEDDEDKAAWALRKAAYGLPSSIPLVRDIAGSMESGYDYSFSPIANQIAKIPKFAKKYSGDKDIEAEPLTLDILDLVGGFAGLPGTGQALTTLRYLNAVEEGKKPKPASGAEKAKNAILGPPPKRK